jgi:hypothetical protein
MDCFRLRSSSFGGHVVASLLAMTRVDINAASYSAYRERRVHLSERLVDDRFSIVIGDASDGIVYFHAAPLHVAVMPIRSRLFRFLVF